MEKKYELTNETIEVYERTLHRIKALKDFNDVKKGDLGGFIEKEDNLSHEGNCWIYDNAYVCDNACVYDNSCVSGNAHVYDNVYVCDKARIYGNTRVYGNAKIFQNARIYGKAHVYAHAQVCGNAQVFDHAIIGGEAYVCGNAYIYDHVWLTSNALVKSPDDIYYYLSNFGNDTHETTFFKCADNSIKVRCSRSCFRDTSLDRFRDLVKEKYGDTKYTKECLLAADLAEFKLSE